MRRPSASPHRVTGKSAVAPRRAGDSFAPEIPRPTGLLQLPTETVSGVYFLWHGSEVVYVGQSRNLTQRVCQHIQDAAKRFDGMSFIAVAVARLGKVERRYIEALLPRYNRCGIATAARHLRAHGHVGPVSEPHLTRNRKSAARARLRWRNRQGPLTNVTATPRLRGRAAVEQRKRRMKRTHGLCELCESKGRVRAADVVDHIVPLKKGGTDEDENTRNLCDECHRLVTAEQFGHRVKRRIATDGWPVE
jgi:5-methylcytosine-specific restriction protein A